MQRLTMEGRGCRREVPGLALALFLGQQKASSGPSAMLGKNVVQPVSVGVWGGRLPAAGLGAGPIHKCLQEST